MDRFIISDLYFNPNVCHICKTTSDGIKKCKGCNMISYCSKEHQKLHWSSHKDLCKSLQGIKTDLGNYYYDTFKFSYKTDQHRWILQTETQPITSELESSTAKDLTIKNETLGNTNNINLNENLSDGISDKISQNKVQCVMGFTKNECQNTESLVVQNIQDSFKQKWTQFKFTLLDLSAKRMGRNMRNIEKEIVLNPKCCLICKESGLQLIMCESCFSVNHCSEHIDDKSHTAHCEQYKLLFNVNKYLVDKYIADSFAYIEKISNFLEPYCYEDNLEYYELSEYTSYYRTLVHLIKFLNFSQSLLTLHVVGASEYECSPFSVYLWENIFHQLNFVQSIVIIFVGFHVTNDEYELKLCSKCVESGRKLNIECYQKSYDSYIDTSRSNIHLPTDLIIAYNSGFHEFENHTDSNTWMSTLYYFLNTKHLPIAFTAYTKEEIQRDTHIIKKLAESRHDIGLHFNMECEINEEASERPRIDPEDGVYYLNKYISCFYCK